jgi:hypothetical protein
MRNHTTTPKSQISFAAKSVMGLERHSRILTC